MQYHCHASHPNCIADAVAHVVPSLFDHSTYANFDVLYPIELSNYLYYAMTYCNFFLKIETNVFSVKIEYVIKLTKEEF